MRSLVFVYVFALSIAGCGTNAFSPFLLAGHSVLRRSVLDMKTYQKVTPKAFEMASAAGLRNRK